MFTGPFQLFCSGFFSFMLVAPMMWWVGQSGRPNVMRTPNIFYENSCTAEEIERFRHQDVIENLGYTMMTQPGYGYHRQADPTSV